MLKIIGISAIILSTALVGMQISKRYQKRVIILKKIEIMLREMSVNIAYREMTIYEIITRLCENEAVTELDFLQVVKKNMDLHINFYTAWKNAVDEWNTKLNSSDKKLLEEFGNSLGKSNTEGEIANLNAYSHQLSTILRDAEEESKTKGKLIRSLGILAGAFISVMLI